MVLTPLIAVRVIELRVSRRKEEEHGQNSENRFIRNIRVKLSLDLQFIFDVFSTVISPKEVTESRKLEFLYVWYNAGTPIASLYTQYYRSV